MCVCLSNWCYLVVGREELVLAERRHGLLELRLPHLFGYEMMIQSVRPSRQFTFQKITPRTLSAWEEESFDEVQRDHSTRSSGVGSDHVISTYYCLLADSIERE
jgi:hypothetical protein